MRVCLFIYFLKKHKEDNFLRKKKRFIRIDSHNENNEENLLPVELRQYSDGRIRSFRRWRRHEDGSAIENIEAVEDN